MALFFWGSVTASWSRAACKKYTPGCKGWWPFDFGRPLRSIAENLFALFALWAVIALCRISSFSKARLALSSHPTKIFGTMPRRMRYEDRLRRDGG